MSSNEKEGLLANIGGNDTITTSPKIKNDTSSPSEGNKSKGKAYC